MNCHIFEDGRLAREQVYLDEGQFRHVLTKPGARDT